LYGSRSGDRREASRGGRRPPTVSLEVGSIRRTATRCSNLRSPLERLRSVVRTLLPTGSVAERAVKSGVWVGATNVVARSLSLVRLVVLASLLSPDAFGLMGIALLTTSALNQVSQPGVDEALVQRADENVDEYLDTAWTVKLLRGVLAAGVTYLVAPYAGAFFGEPRAVGIIRAVSVVPVLVGLQNPRIVYFQKDLQFHKRLVHQVSGTAVDTAVALAAAVALGSVWALVAGLLAGKVIRLVVSYAIHGYRPRPSFDRERAVELISYGKWITGLSVLVFLTNSGDDAFVGWLLGSSALGVYQLAYQLSNAPATEISQVISTVVFPAYSKVQDDVAQLREGYFRTLTLTAFCSFPTAVGIVVVAPPFVHGFLGEKWAAAVPIIQILAIWGLLRALGSTSGPLFQAVGRPDLSTKIQAGKVVLVALLIYPLAQRFGLAGVAAVVVLNSVVFSEPVVYYLAMETLDGSYRRLARTLLVPGAASVAMGLAVLAVRESVGLPPAVEFAVLVVVGVAAYAGLFAVIERRFDYGIEPLLRTMVRAVRS
jgi:PST family polysaccharide transporter/lipopolysaccharide exporter